METTAARLASLVLRGANASQSPAAMGTLFREWSARGRDPMRRMTMGGAAPSFSASSIETAPAASADPVAAGPFSMVQRTRRAKPVTDRPEQVKELAGSGALLSPAVSMQHLDGPLLSPAGSLKALGDFLLSPRASCTSEMGALPSACSMTQSKPTALSPLSVSS